MGAERSAAQRLIALAASSPQFCCYNFRVSLTIDLACRLLRSSTAEALLECRLPEHWWSAAGRWISTPSALRQRRQSRFLLMAEGRELGASEIALQDFFSAGVAVEAEA